MVFPSSFMSSAVGFRSLCVYSRPSATSEHTVWTRLDSFYCNSGLMMHLHVAPLTSPLFSQVGLFRKSGVKSRIQALRQQCEVSTDSVSYEDQSAYDVADMVKQFFRDLPEPLLTSKLGETFLHIYQCKSPLG